MPLLTIHHKTEDRYARPVAFGEYRIMLSFDRMEVAINVVSATETTEA